MLFLLLMYSYIGLFSQGHSIHLDIDDPQTRVLWDSLIVYNKANQYYEAIPLLLRITQQAEKVGEIEALAFAYENLAELRQLEGKLKEAQKYSLLAIKYLFEIKDWDNYATRLRRLSNLLSSLGDHDAAFYYLNQVKKIKHKIENENIIHLLHADLGDYYFTQNKFDSVYYYRKLYVNSVSVLDTNFSNQANIAMAVTLININDYDRAMIYAKRALDFTNPKKYPLSYAKTLGRIGYVEAYNGNIEVAKTYFNDAINLLNKTKHSEKLMSYFCTLSARNYIELGDYTEAKKMIAIAQSVMQKQDLNSSIDYHIAVWELAIIDKDQIESERLHQKFKNFNKILNLYHESRIAKLNSWHFDLLEDKKNALRYFEKYSLLKDSLQTIQNAKAIQNIEIQFETEKKDIEIATVSNKIRLQRNGLLVGVALLFGLFVLLYFNEKSKKRISIQNKMISSTLKEKEILLKEIHHRVKNNLQVISSLLSIQSRSINDKKAKEAIVEGRTRVHSMSLIHQDLYKKDNLTGIRMDRYLGSLTKDLLDTYNISEGMIILDNQIEPLKLDVDSVIPMGLIVNELMSNALKYAFPENRDGKIAVLLKEQGASLLLQVSDNGIGMKEQQINSNSESFGYTLIRAFKNKLDAKIDIQSEGGTVVSLVINNYKKVV